MTHHHRQPYRVQFFKSYTLKTGHIQNVFSPDILKKKKALSISAFITPKQLEIIVSH